MDILTKMFIILMILACILGLIAYLLVKSELKDAEKRNSNPLTRVNYSDSYLTYIGGFPTIEGDKRVVLEIHEKNLEFNFWGGKTEKIQINDLKDSQIITKEQFFDKINLGKILMFGAFAIGMKDKKTIYKNYMELIYKDDLGKDRSVIFSGDKIENDVKYIRNLIKTGC